MQPCQVLSQINDRRPAALWKRRILNVSHKIRDVRRAILPVGAKEVRTCFLIANPKFVDELRRDPIVADRISPTMPALSSIELAWIRPLCVVERVDRRVALPAPAEERVILF